MEMTRQVLLDSCKQHKLYRTPSLNDKLYLNFKGFTRIANLEAYTALRALFLEGNALDSLEGLSSLQELRCLYVQQNCIAEVSGLEALHNLDTINLSHNQLRRLGGLACCPALRTLICTNNYLSSVESVAHLAQCGTLHTLDLQHNNISDPSIVDVLRQLPELRCLYLKGNPVVSNIKNYRKTVVGALPELKYLDERPVFDDERRLVTAWLAGGLEAEERARIRQEEQERSSRNFEMMQAIRRQGWRKRREREGLPPGDTDPMLDVMSDSDYEFEVEPAELVAARERLAAFTARQGEEEPPELSAARQARAAAGGKVADAIGDGEGITFEDGTAYLQSVKAAQAELDAAGRPSIPSSMHAPSVDDTIQEQDTTQQQRLVEPACATLSEAQATERSLGPPAQRPTPQNLPTPYDDMPALEQVDPEDVDLCGLD